MLKSYQRAYKKTQHFEFPPIHDPCVIYYILHPDRFLTKKVEALFNLGNY